VFTGIGVNEAVTLRFSLFIGFDSFKTTLEDFVLV
jgi:hypothetical protein